MDKLLASVMISFLVMLLIYILVSLLECIRFYVELTALKFYPLVLGGFSSLVALIYYLL